MFEHLLNDGPKKLKAYVPGKNAKDFMGKINVPLSKVCKLSSNENPIGPSPNVKSALENALNSIYFYPDPDASDLKMALAKKYSCATESIALGNGSDELITQLIRLFANKKRGVLSTKHSFPAYKIAATACHCAYQEVPDIHFNTNLEALIEASHQCPPAIIFIANPNNPSGTWLTHDKLASFVANISEETLIVLDEAYFEYTNTVPNFVNSLNLFQHHPNIIILRTFSKAYGLAGLRLGYAIAHPSIIKAINTIRLPFNVNALAQVAAIAALKDEQHLALVQKINQEGRADFYHILTKAGLAPIKSASNSLMFDAGQKVDWLNDKLISHGIITRMLAPFGCPTHMRINTGTKAQNEYVSKTFARIYGFDNLAGENNE